MQINGLDRVQAKLTAMGQRSVGPGRVSVVVGYTASYSLHVHENLESHHPVGKAKYLEDPAREYAGVLGEIISETYKETKDLHQSLLVAGLRLQRESQVQVPIDTGNLKNSAFTEKE